jgi:hypothetical protein
VRAREREQGVCSGKKEYLGEERSSAERVIAMFLEENLRYKEQTMAENLYEEVEIEDMVLDEETQIYSWSCPCGDR